MEKFAVDLDKVLDELEFDEDQAENAISGGKFMVPSNNQVVNPLYHMPAFDPMTAPPPCSSSLSTNGQYRLGSGGTFSWRQDTASQKKSVSGVFSSLNDYITSSENVPSSVIAPDDDDDQDDDEPWIPPRRPSAPDDKKPDVVGSSTADSFDVSLPDVAAGAPVATDAPAPATDDITSALDLIKHPSNADAACDVSTSEPLATTSTSSDDPTDPGKNSNMIRFGLTEDLSDSELHQYLEELEAEEEEARMSAPTQPWRQDEEAIVDSSDGKPSLLEELEQQEELISLITEKEALHEDLVSSTNDASSACEVALPSGRDEDVVSSTVQLVSSQEIVEESVVEPPQESVSSEPQEELVSSAGNCAEESVCEPESSELGLQETKPLEECRKVQEVPDTSLAESSQSSQVASSSDAHSISEEMKSTEEESVPVDAAAEKSQPEPCVEEPVSSMVCGPISSGFPEQSFEEPRTSDLEEQRTSDFEEQRTSDLEEQRTIGLEEQRTSGLEEQRTSGFEEQRTSGFKEQRTSGFEEQRASGFEEQRTSGFEEQRTSDFEKQRTSGFEEQRASGFEEQRTSGFEEQRTSDFEEQRTSGFEEQRMSGLEEQRTSGLEEQRTIGVEGAERESKPESGKPSDVAIDEKPARPSTLELSGGSGGDAVGSSDDNLPYSEPGPAGATPIATRPPPTEATEASGGESPVQSPDHSEDTSSVASGSEGAAAAAVAVAAGGDAEGQLTAEERRLGKAAPVWIADESEAACMLCQMRFTVIRRRHHCRACGRLVCAKCGSARAPLPFMANAEARVCVVCHKILSKIEAAEEGDYEAKAAASEGAAGAGASAPASVKRTPNPNNPMEYCSTVPPLQQAAGALQQPAPSVMVPVVGVLKREGSTKPRSEAKQVMFSDGIRPGGDLTELDGSAEPRLPIRRPGHMHKRVGTPTEAMRGRIGGMAMGALPTIERTTNSYIPDGDGDGLPPLATKDKGKVTYEKNPDCGEVMALLRDEGSPPLRFALNRNLYVIVKIVTLDCCVKRVCWCFTSDGLSCVGQDEVVIVLETRNEDFTVPKDVFLHINYIYHEAATGNTVAEMGHTLAMSHSFLGSNLHAGFMYIRHTSQCVQRLILPPAPFLFAVLIHRWEVPWVRIFPIRLMLRLGAEYRYYPCPLISVRERPSVYGEIGDTVIKFLADFREMQYTLPSVRGLVIHMEDKRITVLLPRNRYDQVLRALNQSNDHVLAFAANFSEEADSHLVCMQSEGEESKYYTSAIEISFKTRKVTGASFIVFSGGLKASCGMNAKSSIKEDGFVISVTSETLDAIRAALHDMKDYRISCGPISAAVPGADKGAAAVATTNPGDGEEVLLKWTKDDCYFNVGVKSEVDGKSLDGVPSMRVHSGIDYPGGSRLIRWTEVFLLQMDEGSGRAGDSVDISRLSSALSEATCLALVRLLDLLAAVGIYTLAVRATIHPDNVGYEAGSNGEHLPPIYMNSLDDALIPVLNKAAANSADGPTLVELVFKIMDI